MDTGLYADVFAALLLAAGRLGDRFGRRRIFIVGVVIFMAGSLLAAFATGGGTPIAARVVQGLVHAAVEEHPNTRAVTATLRAQTYAYVWNELHRISR
jgi:MFS family permease